MKREWQFGQQLALYGIPERKIREVLIDYDGPQLCILEKGPERFLSVRIDEDATGTRWIQSPLSSVEYEALMLGTLSVRNALLKTEMILVEENRNEVPIRAWTLSASSVPDTALPKVDAPLPRYVRSMSKYELPQDVPAAFHLEAARVSGYQLPFEKLSKATASLQRLWNTLASTFGKPELVLSAVALERGSFKVRVEVIDSDRALFAQVADVYRDLARATFDGKRLAEALAKKPQTVSYAYSDYLTTLDKQKLDVLAQWRERDDAEERSAFVGYAGAGRSRKSIKFEVAEQPTRETIRRIGYLDSFAGKKNYFEFYESTSGAAFSGGIAKTLRDAAIRGEVLLTHQKKCSVTMEMQQVGSERPTFTLLEFSHIED